jgi:hypothetical protein
MPDVEGTHDALAEAKAEAEGLTSSGAQPGEAEARASFNQLAEKAHNAERERMRRAWREGAQFGHQYASGASRLPDYIAARNPYGPEFPGTTLEEDEPGDADGR